MNYVEGYSLRNCTCSTDDPQRLEFVETEWHGEHRFLLVCASCGRSSPECKTKEQAVHKWNSHRTPIFG
jgi:hypothetical protein